jgi:hypothetical protein
VFVSVGWMALTSIVFFFPTTKHTGASDMNYTVVVLGGAFILSLVWYYFPVYGGVHWFEGPVPTVDGYVARRWVTSREVEGVMDTVKEKEDTNIEVTSEIVLTQGNRDL